MTDLTKQAFTYLVVGAWNTLFGTAVYFGFVWLFDGLGRYCYMLAAAAGNVVAISESFLTYKLIVFRTRGNWLREYAKCWLVYGGVALVGMALLPVFVEGARLALPGELGPCAPYLGGLATTGLTIVVGFVGHRNVTFRKGVGATCRSAGALDQEGIK